MSEHRDNAAAALPPVLQKQWIHVAFVLVVVFIAAFGTRYMDYAKWQNPMLQVDGQYIMATHDAYHWLAGAKGVGASVGTPMATMASWLSDTLGVGLDKIAFWTPAVAAGLTACVVALWGWTLGGVGVGFFAGILSVLGAGFYFRTRLGFYDTDIVTLLFPLLVSWLLAVWVRQEIDRNRLKRLGLGVLGRFGVRLGHVAEPVAAPPDDMDSDPIRSLFMYGVPFAAGIVANWAGAWHGQLVTYTVLLILGCLVLGMALLPRNLRVPFLWGGILYSLCCFEGTVGMGIGFVLLLGFIFKGQSIRRLPFGWLIATLCLAVLVYRTDFFDMILGKALGMFFLYGNASGTGVAASGGTSISYPDILQSVIEAQRFPLSEVLNKIHPWTGVVWLGSILFLGVCVVRPEAALLLPLLILSFASTKLGVRMAMFGGPCYAIGLAMLVQWILGLLRVQLRPVIRLGVQCVAWLVVTWVFAMPFFEVYPHLPATPIMSNHHASGLMELGKHAPKDSMVWTWWDWGFPTNYYAGLKSFGDGANHAGPVIYPLGMVLGTPNPMQSNQMMKYLANNKYNLSATWQDLSFEKVVNDLRILATKDIGLKAPQKQYIVFSYENLRLIHWIMYYATWDLMTKKGHHPQSSILQGAIKVDTKEGVLINAALSKDPVKLKSIDILSTGGRKYISFKENNSKFHLLLNEATGEHHIMDDMAYSSLLVQGLIAPPEVPLLKRYFKLVYENFPYIRIYEAR